MRKPVRPLLRRQRGALLLAMFAIFALGASWMTLAALNANTNRTATNRAHNARVLSEAKAALIGWIAATALETGENNPGRLPCPQAWGDVGSDNEGRAAGTCAQPAIGWLPWRTLGLPVMRDAHGEQLWYAISPGWHLPNGSTNLTINSSSTGQLSLNGQAAVALIIAPGPALTVTPDSAQTSAGCSSRTQSRTYSLPSTEPNVLDFLECQNGSTSDYTYTANVVNNASNVVFNDQVVAVTTADILPALEAAIAKRIERDVVPSLQTVFAGPDWGLSSGARMYPFAATFADPGPGSGTSSYVGASGTYQGLLPFNQTQGCTVESINPRCTTSTALLGFTKSANDVQLSGTGSIRTQSSCSWDSEVYVCTGNYNQPSISVQVTINVTNVAMGMRTLDTTSISCTAVDDVGAGIGQQTVTPCTVGLALQSNGSLTLTVSTGDLPNIPASGWGTWATYSVRVPRAIFGDHALLSSTDSTTGWFVRNEWFRLVYYAAAQTYTAANLPSTPACTTGSNCLRLRTLPSGSTASDKRALLILAGRANSDQTRPSSSRSNYVEYDNNDGGTRYSQSPIRTIVNTSLTAPFNDRVVVIDAN